MGDKTKTFVSKSHKIHNNKYIYDKVKYKGVDTKVIITCPVHGDFLQTPRLHLYKKAGCNSCCVDRQRQSFAKTSEDFISQAKRVHNNYFLYEKTKYVNARTKVTITCPVHGDFLQEPSSHLRGNGCKQCANIKRRVSTNDFINRSNEKHNEKYSYENVDFFLGKRKIIITCPVHGDFEQSGESHLAGTGCPMCGVEQNSFQSLGETEISDYIKSLNVQTQVNNRTILYPKELDIFIPSHNLAIEYDGIFWHSELGGKDRNYHIEKTRKCNEKLIHLIHIFESEWKQSQDLVKSRICSLLGKNATIYARECVVEELDIDTTRSFLNENHSQGFVSSSISLGLKHQGMLVGVMTFGHPRFAKDFQWELLRFCCAKFTNVVGGANKLFKCFIRKYNPQSIISYSDKRWNRGTIYPLLGFEYSHTSKPNYFYFLGNDTLTLLNRQKFQKHKLQTTLEYFDANLTEWENMIMNGYNRIWDCGNDVFVYRTQ